MCITSICASEKTITLPSCLLMCLSDCDRTKNWNCAEIENLIKVAVMMPLREIIYQNGEGMGVRKANKQYTLVRPVQPEDFLSAFDAVRAVCRLLTLNMLNCAIISFLVSMIIRIHFSKDDNNSMHALSSPAMT